MSDLPVFATIHIDLLHLSCQHYLLIYYQRHKTERYIFDNFYVFQKNRYFLITIIITLIQFYVQYTEL